MDKDHITEQILKLTLEIIYLLTGEVCRGIPGVVSRLLLKRLLSSEEIREDYSVISRAGKHVGTIRGTPRQPGGLCKVMSPITHPQPLSEVHEKNNNQKILDLTNKIIQLLTGEVPIRCEDIIVCFSMEEWKYVEGHKDLYKNIMENHPFLGSSAFSSSENLSMKLNLQMLSPDTAYKDHSSTSCKRKVKNNVFEDIQEVTLQVERDQFTNKSTCTKYTQTEPTACGEDVLCEDEEADVIFVPTENVLIGCSSDASKSFNEQNPKDSDFVLLTEQIQNPPYQQGSALEPGEDIYTTTCLKSTHLTDRPTKWVTNVNFVECPITPHHINTKYTSSCVIEVASTCEDGDVICKDVFTPTDHKTLYTSEKMEETPMSLGKDIIYTNIYTPADLTQADLTNIKKELNSWEDGSLELQNIYIAPKPMEEKAVYTSGRGDSVQWNGSQAHRDSYQSVEHTLPHIKTECEQGDYEDDYITPGQIQSTHAPVHPADKDSIKKENKNMSVVNYTTDDENDNGRPADDTSQMYSCSDCTKCFSSDTNLAKHRLMCRGRKPHVCSGCGKCFASASYLVIHERIHTGEKPYSCSHCGKSFTRKPDLIRHERIHTGEKPFACPECGKCFTSVSNIFMHRRIHTGEKPFPCAACGKRFIKKSDLVRHEKIHLPQEPLPCSLCGKMFASKTILSKHMAAHATEMPQTAQEGS